ncbi:MAG: hypothetical protein ACI35S_01570 [Anaeroplasma sp.]
MKKLIKTLIFFVIFIILIVVLLVGIVIFITYDKEELDYATDATHNSIEYVIGEDIIESIKKIDENNYEDNNIYLSFSQDELNTFLIELIRKNINEKFLIDEDYILVEKGVKLNSILFQINDNIISLKISLSYRDIYYTTITCKSDLYIDNNVIYIRCEEYGLGNNLSISKSTVDKVLDAFSVDLLNQLNTETKDYIFSFNIDEMVGSTIQDNLLVYLIQSLEFDSKIENNILILYANTSILFDGGTAIPEYENPDGLIADKMMSYDPIIGYIEVSLNSAQLNYLIKDNLNSNLFKSTVTINAGEINLALSKMYYSIMNNSIKSNLSINEASTTATIETKVINNETSLSINIFKVYLNELEIYNQSIFIDEFVIDSKTLGLDEYFIINKIIVNKEKDEITLNLSKK